MKYILKNNNLYSISNSHEIKKVFTGTLQECRAEMDRLKVAENIARIYNGRTVAETAIYRVVVIDGFIYRDFIYEIKRISICEVKNLRLHLQQRRRAHVDYAWNITELAFFAALDCIA